MSFAIIRLRKSQGAPKQGEFKTPFVPFLPILAIIICASFMSQYMPFTWLAFAISTLIGTLIYVLYGYKHSKEHFNKEL